MGLITLVRHRLKSGGWGGWEEEMVEIKDYMKQGACRLSVEVNLLILLTTAAASSTLHSLLIPNPPLNINNIPLREFPSSSPSFEPH